MKEEIRPGEARGARYPGQRPSPPHVAQRLEDLAILVYRNRGGEIHGSDCSDVYWYHVVSGVARCYIVLQGGRRQILDLLLPGDFFGFTGPESHFYGVDATLLHGSGGWGPASLQRAILCGSWSGLRNPKAGASAIPAM
jgi:hypothetical protein